MPATTLDETLLALIEAVRPPDGSGITVTEVEMDVPLEASVAVEEGKIVVYAGVPHSRWVSGFLPRVHLSHLRVELTDEAAHG
jgi:hypothetical protein